MKTFFAIAILVQGICGYPYPLDSKFHSETSSSQLQINDIDKSIKDITKTIMFVAEYVYDTNEAVQSIKNEVNLLQSTLSKKLVKRSPSSSIVQREELASKVEKMLAVENVPQVEVAKKELEDKIQTNFIKMLSAIIVTGPVHVQHRTQDILRLMRTVLNGEMDFKPVIQKLPFLLRDNETNQFVILMKTMRESERNSFSRQFGGLNNLDKIVDILGTVDLKEVSGFLKELPELFEGVESVVDGVEEYF